MLINENRSDLGVKPIEKAEYMNRRLVEANIKNDIVIIEEVEGLVTEFRDTWKEVIRINRQQQFGQGNTGQI